MSFPWIRSWLKKKHQTPARRPGRKTHCKVQLRLEALEDRVLPAFYLVTTLDDNTNAVDTSPAGTEADPFLAPSLRSALSAANASTGEHDTILFDTGLTGTSTLTLGQLTISDDVTITGPGAADLAVSGNNASRVFNVDDGTTATITVVIDGLTITGGSANVGGGIYNRENLTVRNSTLAGNSAISGGGLFNFNGTVTVQNSTVSGNSAGSSSGGGLHNRYGPVTVQNSTLSGNSAISGGGLYNRFGTATVTNSTLSGNSAVVGGGLFNYNSMTTLANSLVTGNTADSGREVVSNGGGVQADAFNLFGHSGSTSAQAFVNFSPGDNDIDATGSAGFALGAILDTTLRDNGGPTMTHALVPGSPASDAGDPAFDPDDFTPSIDFDQRGNPFVRVFGGQVDIGAYEAQTLALVVDTLDDEDDGDFSPGQLSLREAVRLANANPGADTITFASGLTGTITLTLGQLNITDHVTITGPGAADLAVSGNNAGRVFNVNDGTTATITVVIDGLTITGGSVGGVDSGGGGIYNRENLTVRNSTLAGNTGGSGGGLFNRFGAVTVQNSTLSGNSASFGGGLRNGSGAMTVRNSTLSGNTASFGGGLYIDSGTVTVQDSTLSGNSATLDGGGVANRGWLTVQNSTLSGNSADVGGGLYSFDGTVTVQHSIVANSINGDLGGGGTFAVDFSLIEDGSQTATGANNLSGDPLLGPLQDNGGPTQTHALLPGSPAIDAGDPAFDPDDFTPPLDFDQRGHPFVRISGGRVDIGAFEVQTLALVVDTLDDEDDGDFSPGDLSLREALRLANANPGADTITFASGLTGTITLTLGQLTISDDVTITGPGAADLAVSGNNASRVFIVDDGTTATITVVIDGLTITGGSEVSGGGIFNNESLTVRNSTLSGNSALFGGGLYNESGTVTVRNSTLSGNYAYTGGGLYNRDGTMTVQNSALSGNYAYTGGGGGLRNNSGTVTVQHSTLSGNSASEGGGLLNNSGTLTVQNSTLSGNSASVGGGLYNVNGTMMVLNSTLSGNSAGFGGGLYNVNGTVMVRNSTLSGNSASFGGGLYNVNGTLTVRNSTLSGNSATFDGGGLYNSNGTVTVRNSTLSGNSAYSGGGLYNDSGTVTLRNSIVANSTNGDLVGNGTFAVDFSLIEDGSQTATGANNLSGDPLLGPLQDNGGPTQTHALLPGSPAIDAGDPAFDPDDFNPPLDFDQRGVGFDRVADGRIDIGAFEFPTLSFGALENVDRFLLVSNQTINPSATLNVPLQYTIDQANAPLGLQVYNLDQELGLIKFFDNDYRENLHGGNEKWLFSTALAETAHPWFFLLPNGDLHRFQGEANPLDGARIAELDAILWEDPRLLHEAAIPAEMLADQLVALDSTLGLIQFNDGDYRENLWGGNEKWLYSEALADTSFPWFFLTPGGALHRYQGEANPLDAAQVAVLSRDVWIDPALLHEASSTPPVLPALTIAIDSTGNATITAPANVAGIFEVTISVSNGDEQIEKTFLVGVANTPPTLEDIDPVSLSSGSTEAIIQVNGSDPEAPPQVLDFDVRQSAYVFLHNLDQGLGLIQFPDGDYRENLHGGNEKWLFSEALADTSFPWFFITPEGTLHRFTGQADPLTAPVFATLTPLAWADPTLLHEATPPQNPDAAGVTTTIDSNNEITITNTVGFTGPMLVTVTLSDGFHAVVKSFVVNWE